MYFSGILLEFSVKKHFFAPLGPSAHWSFIISKKIWKIFSKEQHHKDQFESWQDSSNATHMQWSTTNRSVWDIPKMRTFINEKVSYMETLINNPLQLIIHYKLINEKTLIVQHINDLDRISWSKYYSSQISFIFLIFALAPSFYFNRSWIMYSSFLLSSFNWSLSFSAFSLKNLCMFEVDASSFFFSSNSALSSIRACSALALRASVTWFC